MDQGIVVLVLLGLIGVLYGVAKMVGDRFQGEKSQHSMPFVD